MIVYAIRTTFEYVENEPHRNKSIKIIRITKYFVVGTIFINLLYEHTQGSRMHILGHLRVINNQKFSLEYDDLMLVFDVVIIGSNLKIRQLDFSILALNAVLDRCMSPPKFSTFYNYRNI